MVTSRRDLLLRAAGLAGLALTPSLAPGIARARLAEDPFSLGVASGEPTADGVVLWTRLAPRPLDPDGGMAPEPVEVDWEVYEDQALSRLAARGREIAVPEAAHSVHAEVAGLRPDREYWYRFTAGGQASGTGRTRTAPEAGAQAQRLRVAFGSCQKYEAGYYAAHRRLADDIPDLVLFLGDYIYEGAATDHGVRRHPGPEAKDLTGYRLRYGAYKSDPNLQAAHAVAPWMVIWDDHEVENDYAGDQDPEDSTPAAFLLRRAAAYQAYYEHMPLRRPCRPVGPQMLLHRSLDWGQLAQFQLLDTRQYRPRSPGRLAKRLIHDTIDRNDPRRSILGGPQERWLYEKLATTTARWNVLTQQYVLGEMRLPGGWFSSDGWDGYPACRSRILSQWRDAKVSNPLALGGDIHTFVAGDLPGRSGEGPVIASEFVGGSLSSHGYDKMLVGAIRGANPRVRLAETQYRGYGLMEITPDRCEVAFRAVLNAQAPASPVRTLAKFVVEDGEAGLKNA